MRLAMPDSHVAGISVESAQTGCRTHYDGQFVEVTDSKHERALREYGAFPVNLGGRPIGGYRCTVCDFAGFFVRCGRCGSPCEKED